VKIYDCFTFLNEFDILKLRLAELAGYVDYFVLVECPYTFSGLPKPLYYRDNPITGYNIRYVLVENLPREPQKEIPLSTREYYSLINEHYQRDVGFKEGCESADASDTIFGSDVDEIPRPSKIREGDLKVPTCFLMKWYNYFLNCECIDPMINPYRGTGRGDGELLNSYLGGQAVFFARGNPGAQTILDGGWHFSCQGGVDLVLEKLRSFSHVSLAEPEFQDRDRVSQTMAAGGDIMYGKYGDRRHAFVSVDDTFPFTITSNIDQWKHLLAPNMS
jgi:beta-1,4-mannosyl-glycoprotein beta-1,4-N-acetylglucosaminyltransferase